MSDTGGETNGGTQAPTESAPAGGAVAGISAQFAGDASPVAAAPGETELPPEQDHQRYRTLRDAVQKELNQRAARFAADEELDDHARDWKLQTLWDSALSADTKISELYEKELQDGILEAEKKVYRVPKNLMDSTRSAYSMVESEMEMASLEDGDAHERLERLYDRAQRTQDTALQLACFHRATELGIDYLRDKHLETSPELSKAVENYNLARQKLADWTSKEENLVQRLNGLRGVFKPPEIR